MSTHPRKAEVRTPITSRLSLGGAWIRVLQCGHTQPEPSGGKAHLAESAVCRHCRPNWKARRR